MHAWPLHVPLSPLIGLCPYAPSQIAGLVGGLGVVPLCAAAPVAMWQMYNRERTGRALAAFHWCLVALLLCVAAATTVASLEQIVDSADTFAIFA